LSSFFIIKVKKVKRKRKETNRRKTMDVYGRIKKYRQERGWTQSDLAHKMGYSDKAVISKIEHGDIDLPLSKVEMLANIFGVHPGDLMGDVPVTVNVTEHERDVLMGYRKAEESIRNAIDDILHIEKKEKLSLLENRKEA
jgi:transcriptional regulator with XRE-family HTH domain